LNRTRTLTFTALTLLLLATSFLLLTAQAATTETFTVTQRTYQITFNLPAGTAFNGSLSTTGTVRVWVNDANGALITNPGLVDKTAIFNFTAAKDGNYYVNFENPLSSTASVTFTYQTDPEIPSNNQPILPFWLLPVFIAITVAGCVLILYFSRKRKHSTA
jgi:hypothetical protein